MQQITPAKKAKQKMSGVRNDKSVVILSISVSDPDPGILTKSDPDTDPECEEKRTFLSISTYFFLDFDAALTLICYK